MDGKLNFNFERQDKENDSGQDIVSENGMGVAILNGEPFIACNFVVRNNETNEEKEIEFYVPAEGTKTLVKAIESCSLISTGAAIAMMAGQDPNSPAFMEQFEKFSKAVTKLYFGDDLEEDEIDSDDLFEKAIKEAFKKANKNG